ncbi:hypothetical protein PG984_011468 [Apiospora sp. TS-2023a]
MLFTASSLLLALAPLAALGAPAPYRNATQLELPGALNASLPVNASLLANASLPVNASQPELRAALNDPYDDFKVNEFWLYSDYIEGGEVRGIRGLDCNAARNSRIWYKKNDLSGNKRRGSRYFEPGQGPSLPHALEVHTDYMQFTLYNSRGPWTLYDTYDKINGKCKEDTSGRYDCGDIMGLSLFKCVGWAPPYNLAGMN